MKASHALAAGLAAASLMLATTGIAVAGTVSSYPQGTWFTVDGITVSGFDPSDGWDDPDTSSTESATWNVSSGSTKIHDLPDGWTVQADIRTHASTGEQSAFYIVKDSAKDNVFRWYFDGATGITRTVDELRSVTLTVGDSTVDVNDPTQDVEVHGVTSGTNVGINGIPTGWDYPCTQFTENGVTGFRYVVSPSDSDDPTVTYTFYYDSSAYGEITVIEGDDTATGDETTDTGVEDADTESTGTTTGDDTGDGTESSSTDDGTVSPEDTVDDDPDDETTGDETSATTGDAATESDTSDTSNVEETSDADGDDSLAQTGANGTSVLPMALLLLTIGMLPTRHQQGGDITTVVRRRKP